MNNDILSFRESVYLPRSKKIRYFENWYFKHTSSDGFSFVVIPGIYKTRSNYGNLAFIQVILNDGRSHYFEYFYSDFEFNTERFEFKIGKNYFSKEKMILNINRDISIQATLEYDNVKPLKNNFLCPCMMGIFSYLPFVKCNHSIIGVNHKVSGDIIINGNHKKISDMFGFCKKSYGSLYHRNYITIQGNDCETSFMLSISSFSRKRMKASSVVAFVKTLDNEFRFTCGNFSKIKSFSEDEKYIYITLTKRKFTLSLFIEKEPCTFMRRPTYHGMNREVQTAVHTKVKIIIQQKDKTLLEKEITDCALEYLNIKNMIK